MRFILQYVHWTVACPTKLIFNLLSLALFTWGQRISAGRNFGLRIFHLWLPTPLHFKVSVRTLITNSASQMENKRDTLCFEEIDPWRWQTGCQPMWLWWCYGSAKAAFSFFSFFFFFFYPFVKTIPLDLLLRVNTLRPRCLPDVLMCLWMSCHSGGRGCLQ